MLKIRKKQKRFCKVITLSNTFLVESTRLERIIKIEGTTRVTFLDKT